MVQKPSEKEEEYFARLEFERKKKFEEEKHKKMAQEEKNRLKNLHFMRCPNAAWNCWRLNTNPSRSINAPNVTAYGWMPER